MKIKYRIIVPMTLCLILSCSTKEEKSELIQFPEENLEISTPLPETKWEKSINVARTQSDTSNTGLARILEDQLFAETSQIEELMVKKDQNADYILKSKVDQQEDEIIMFVRVEEAQTGQIVYETESAIDENDYMDSHTSMMTEIAEELQMNVDSEAAESTQTISSEAMALYREAKGLLDKNEYQATHRAVGIFKEALRRDSTFSLAAIGLTHSYLQVIHNGWDKHRAFVELAGKAAAKAVQLAPEKGEAHEGLGLVYLMQTRYKEAESEFLEALDLNPNLSKSWEALGAIYSHFGFYKTSQSAYEKAFQLNADNPELRLRLGLLKIGLGNYKDAEILFKQSLATYPHADYFNLFIAMPLYYQNKTKEADQYIQKGMKAHVYQPLAHAVHAMILIKQKKLDDALGELELEVKPYISNDPSLCVAVAAIYAQLGQAGNAVSWLEQAIGWGYREYPWIVNDPNFSPLRDDPRYHKILEDLHVRWKEAQNTFMQ